MEAARAVQLLAALTESAIRGYEAANGLRRGKPANWAAKEERLARLLFAALVGRKPTADEQRDMMFG